MRFSLLTMISGRSSRRTLESVLQLMTRRYRSVEVRRSQSGRRQLNHGRKIPAGLCRDLGRFIKEHCIDRRAVMTFRRPARARAGRSRKSGLTQGGHLGHQVRSSGAADGGRAHVLEVP